MLSPKAADRIGNQLDELKRRAQTLSADVRLYAQVENEAALRADEVCAAIQRLEWVLDRTAKVSGAGV